MRADTVAELKQFFADNLPNVKAFGGTYNRLTDKTHLLIQPDLQAAGIPYVDESGRFADFHSLRHTTGTLLASANVHPKVAQSLMRHSDINLTMSRYTHSLTGQEAQAVESLPDLSLPSTGRQRAVATGTDDSRLALYLAPQDGQQQTTMDYNGYTMPLFTKENRARQGSNLQPSDSKSGTLSS